MSFYPYNTNVSRRAQSDVTGTATALGAGVMYSPGSPAAEDDNAYVVSVVMAVKTYTLATAAPDVGARNVTLKRTVNGGADTPGTITVTGVDLAGAAISEVLIPGANNVTVVGTRAFAGITSIVGAGWVIADAADTIIVGFGDLIGLPDHLTDTAQVVAASLNNARQATYPTVTVSATVLSLNTVDLDSALNGTPAKVYYWV